MTKLGELNIRVANVNYIDSSIEVLTDDPNILSIENRVKSEVLLTTEELSTWLLDSGASYHVTPHIYPNFSNIGPNIRELVTKKKFEV